MFSHSERRFMERALFLANLGKGQVSPNPMVGCVLVVDEQIIGEGWHKNYGGPHAEVEAVRSVENKEKLALAKMFVTLEPCCHFGKTPPCTDLILATGIKDVFVATTDPNPPMAGKGIELLKSHGITVHQGLLEKEAKWQNKRFFTALEKQRPYVILKWAVSADGFMTPENGEKTLISNEISHQLVHKLRAEEDAFLVGFATAKNDNPKLNTRYWAGKNPVRIVLDFENMLPNHLSFFDQSQRTIVVSKSRKELKPGIEYIFLDENVNWVEALLNELLSQKIQSLVIEGGKKTLESFIQTNAWDEAYVFVGSQNLNKGLKAPVLETQPNKITQLESNSLLEYLNGG